MAEQVGYKVVGTIKKVRGECEFGHKAAVSNNQWVVFCSVVRASLGSILLRILSSAIVWLQSPQLEKKWQEQCHLPSL